MRMERSILLCFVVVDGVCSAEVDVLMLLMHGAKVLAMSSLHPGP